MSVVTINLTTFEKYSKLLSDNYKSKSRIEMEEESKVTIGTIHEYRKTVNA
jgi:hypothetical protein